MFDLVIFDNDGVLVDSEPHAQAILADLLTDAGLPTTVEEARGQYMGSALSRVRERAEPILGKPLPPDFEERYHERLFARFQTDLEPIQDIVWALDKIDVPVCVASSGSRERIRVSLELTGLIDRFAGRMFSADDVKRGKPAPDVFLYAAHSLAVSPTRCAVIEDSSLGVEAANAAGMTSFGFAPTGQGRELRHATGGVFTSMRELPELLDGIG